jgi:hypothetical protein
LNNPDRTRELRLTELREGLPGITPTVGAYLAEAGAIRFEDQNHPEGVKLTVDGRFEALYEVYWQNVTVKCAVPGVILNIRPNMLPVE